MAYPTAIGIPSMSGGYIPQLFSAKLIAHFYDGTCLNEIADTEFEGEIKAYGDKITINTMPTLVTKAYVKGQDVIPDDIDPTPVELSMDKGRSFAFNAYRIDVLQSKIEFMNRWATGASDDMKVKIETDLYEDVYGDVDSHNQGTAAGLISGNIALGTTGAPLAVTSSTALAKLLDIGIVLDEQKVPRTDRWVILPSWYCALLKLSDVGKVYVTGDDKSALRTGKIGMIDNLTIYQSNLLYHATDAGHNGFRILAGHKKSLAFAAQLVENEIITNPRTFGKIVRGLQVYGYKVVKPDAMACLYAYNS
jgi:hypothetical protein